MNSSAVMYLHVWSVVCVQNTKIQYRSSTPSKQGSKVEHEGIPSMCKLLMKLKTGQFRRKFQKITAIFVLGLFILGKEIIPHSP